MKDNFGVTAMLLIEDMASSDLDDYNCTIKNEFGTDSMILSLTQLGKIYLPYKIFFIQIPPLHLYIV